MCPRPHPHIVRHSHVDLDCGSRAGQGCYLPTCARYTPGWVGSPQLSPAHPHMFPPWCVPAMRPWPQAHAVRKSAVYRDCGARVKQRCSLPACPHYALGVWVGTVLRAPQLATHAHTLPPWWVPAMRHWPHPHTVRHSPMRIDCGAWAEKVCCLPAFSHCSPVCVHGPGLAKPCFHPDQHPITKASGL